MYMMEMNTLQMIADNKFIDRLRNQTIKEEYKVQSL